MIATGNTYFVCPRCGKPALMIHRKTYEKNAIIFCTNCHLNTTITPSKDAYYDKQQVYSEFITKYKTNLKNPIPT